MMSATLPPNGSLPGSRSNSRRRRSATLPTILPSITPKPTLITPVLRNLEPTKRIDVLHPPSVPRRTVFLETFDAHGHMQNRCKIMQRREWYRYHGEWQKPRYGNATVQESYRSNIRSVLKSQIEERLNRRRSDWQSALHDSIQLTEKDRADAQRDMDDRREKMRHLNTFTRENKRLMEEKWKDRVREKMIQDQKDREVLKYNPINWSHTLK